MLLMTIRGTPFLFAGDATRRPACPENSMLQSDRAIENFQWTKEPTSKERFALKHALASELP
jgi:hypothetical protein